MESTGLEHSGDSNNPVKEEPKTSSEHVENGISNGLSSKSDSRHKHKHKDKDREKDRHADKHKKDKDKTKDRDSHSSKDSSVKDRSHKDDRRDKEHRDRDKDKDRSRDKDHHRSKDKDSRDKTKDKDNKENRDKDKSKDRHRSEGGSSSSKPHSSSSKDKEKDRHRSSSNKDKHSSDKHRDKHSSSSSSSKHHSSERKSDKLKNGGDVKTEPMSPVKEVKHEESKEIPVEAEKVIIKSEVRSDDETESSQLNIKEEDSVINGATILNEDSKEADPLDPFGGEDDTEDEVPLSTRCVQASSKRKHVEESDDDDVPLSQRKKAKKEKPPKKRKKPEYSDDEDEDGDFYRKKSSKVISKTVKQEPKSTASPTKKKKKEEEEEQNVWKWWEEEKPQDGAKWKFLEHKGPMFAPPYERLPTDVKFLYDGKEMRLSQDAEEIATFYCRFIEHEYIQKEQFNKNFFKDWRKSMTKEEREVITDLSKCDFRRLNQYFVKKSEERKAMNKEEKKKIKEENEAIANEYGVCLIDGHKEKIGNFRIEPPGLFRGRGEHPKMGMLKRRVMPEDVIINCSKDSKKPEPPKGHKWKEVRHDNAVTWLASWIENVQGQVKYVMLNPSSKLKGEKDWQKYETARKLAKCVDKIRMDYQGDLKSREMRIRQRAVAMYFIDKLALRAGNEKDEDQADTVGCCSLRVEHIQLVDKKDDKKNVVIFDFLGKDSIRYYNEVPVEKRVYKNLKIFIENKKGSDDLFDRLNTSVLNKHLNELMEGLTAKVFRTYNASITLQNQLNELTVEDASVPEKILAYNRANRAVAILCNHQRAVPKSHDKSMDNLKEKISTKREQVKEAQKQLKDAKREAKNGSATSKMTLDKKKKALERIKEQLMKLEVQETDKEENKTIALGTSKLNYLDPRISVAWCKKYDVPMEKVYNKTQRSKFRWAIDMAGPDYVF